MRSQGWREAYETSAGTDSGADSSFLSFDDLDDETDEEEERGGAARVKEQTLPDVKEGAVIAGAGLSLTEGKTKPPAPFNEATLLSAMENPVKYMESHDKAMAKTLGENRGTGNRWPTRADIIEKLFSKLYAGETGQGYFPDFQGETDVKAGAGGPSEAGADGRVGNEAF